MGNVFDVSFNPVLGSRGPASQPLPSYQIGGAPPQPRSPHRPSGSYPVSLYNPPSSQDAAGVPGTAEFYRSLQTQNLVDEKVIESIGGIQDTLRPLEGTLKQHELRPYSVQRDYRKDLMRSSRGLSPTGSATRKFDGEIKQENIKLVSVSPFRAVIRVQEDEDQDEDEEDLEAEKNDDSELGIHRQPIMMEPPTALNVAYRASSPIKEDSQIMRSEREQYLHQFNEKKTPRQQMAA
jgi:hypothetical protein